MIRFFFLGIILLFPTYAFCNIPKYVLSVEIIPQKHSIHVRGEIKNLPSSMKNKIYLNREFKVSSASDGKKKLKAHIELNSSSPNYVDIARLLNLSPSINSNTFSFTYDGEIKNEISGINTISSNRVELALYSGWYPLIEGQDLFNFDVTVKTPKGYILTSNGIELSKKSHTKNLIFRFKSENPVNDIVLVGAPEFQRKFEKAGALSYEVFYPTKSKMDVDARLRVVKEALKAITKWYGKADKGSLRFVSSKSRYLNRYEKATILLCLLEKKYGREKLLLTLQIIYGKFKGTRKATTSEFLAILSEHLSESASQFAKDYLSMPWTQSQIEVAQKELL